MKLEGSFISAIHGIKVRGRPTLLTVRVTLHSACTVPLIGVLIMHKTDVFFSYTTQPRQ